MIHPQPVKAVIESKIVKRQDNCETFAAARAVLNTLYTLTLYTSLKSWCQVYRRFDNGDASILFAHICVSKVK